MVGTGAVIGHLEDGISLRACPAVRHPRNHHSLCVRGTGDFDAMGDFECYFFGYGELRLEDTVWGVSGVSGQGDERYGVGELRRAASY